MHALSKSLGFFVTSLLALVGTLVPVNPVYAAGELNVVPSAGTGWGTFSSDVFTLKTNFTGNTASDVTISNLRYEITSKASVIVADANGALFTGIPSGAQHEVVLSPSAPSSSGNILHIGVADPDAAASVDLRVFVDSNQDGTFTAGEWSDSHTVSFTPIAKTPLVIDFAQPISLDTVLTGKLAFAGVNASQVQSNFAVDVSGYSPRTRLYEPLGQEVLSGPLAFEIALNRFLRIGEALSIRVQPGTSFDASMASLNEVFPVVNARLVTNLTSRLVTGPNAVNTTWTPGTNPLGQVYSPGGFSGEARKDSSFDVSAIAAKDAVGTLNVVSTEELSKDVTVSIDGVTYSSNVELENVLVKFVFDKDGLSTHHVTITGFHVGSALNFFFEAEGYSVQTTATVALPHFTLYDMVDRLNNNFRSAAPGSTVSVQYKMVDQFGQPPVVGRFAVATEAVDGLAAAHADFSSGIATVDLKVPETPILHLYSVYPQVYEYGTADSFTQATIYDQVTPEDGFDLQVAPLDQVTPKWVDLAQIQGDARLDDGGTFADFDGRFGIVPAFLHGQTWRLTVRGSDALKHNIAGALVTITAPGLQIVSGNQGGLGTLTLLADQFGEIEFRLYSHKSGPTPFSVSAGSATGASSTSWVPLTLSYVTAVAPSGTYAKGATIKVGFNGFDRYGNVCADTYVLLGASLNGVGYLLGPLSDPWDVVDIAFVNGYGYVKLVNSGVGTATVTVKNVTATLNFGNPVASIAHKRNSKTARVVWSNFFDSTWPLVFVNGKAIAITNSSTTNGSGLRLVNLKPGLNKVRVYLGGLLLAAQDIRLKAKK